jgi:hypothetical protein
MITVNVMNADEIKMPELVYKSCQAKWIITLKTLKDTITNLNRLDVADAQFAKFRGNKFMVVGIEDKLDPSIAIDSIIDSYHAKTELFCNSWPLLSKRNLLCFYKVNEIVEVGNYDMNPNMVNSAGIHFFLSKEAARCYEYIVKDGIYITYHDNGNKCIETNYINGHRHGTYSTYYDNGNKHVTSAYVDDQFHGPYTLYYANGVEEMKCTYVNGDLRGLYTTYHENGKKSCETTYVNDFCHGHFITYSVEGVPIKDVIYENGTEI